MAFLTTTAPPTELTSLVVTQREERLDACLSSIILSPIIPATDAW